MVGEIYTEIVGNSHSPQWAEQLQGLHLDFLDLDHRMAQKSRFVATTRQGRPVAVALRHRSGLREGDLLAVDSAQGSALVVHLLPSELLVIRIEGSSLTSPEASLHSLFELGHALGNQHWPALMHHGEIFVPLVADKKVMQAVLESHRIEGLRYRFESGEEVVPHLSPSEIRILFGTSAPHDLDHHHG